MLAIGNDEIRALPKLGKTVKCWKCGKRHQVHHSKGLSCLAFFRCGSSTYLCGIDGKAWRPRNV
jgi:hypothetical protein